MVKCRTRAHVRIERKRKTVNCNVDIKIKGKEKVHTKSIIKIVSVKCYYDKSEADRYFSGVGQR